MRDDHNESSPEYINPEPGESARKRRLKASKPTLRDEQHAERLENQRRDKESD